MVKRMAEADGRIEGWLYIIRLNKFGFQYLRKRYFVLDDHCFKSFKSVPSSDTEEPLRSSIIGSCIRITDDGREAHRRKAVFVFTMFNTSDHSDQLKLGATSPEEAARWIFCLQNVASNPGHISEVLSMRKWQPFRLSVSNRATRKKSIDWISVSSTYVDTVAADVIPTSPWKIFGFKNGLRLFNEDKDRYPNAKHQENHTAMMSVGFVNGTPEAIFGTIMSLGLSRSEWDFIFCRGSVVEHLDSNTDIIHVELFNHWLPWGMKRRDLLLCRYWRRENDGRYVIHYHSVIHRKCPPKDGYIRACLKSGGYVVTPTKQGEGSVVKYMLAIDWKSYLRRASERSLTIRVLGRTAALAELFKEKGGSYGSYEFSAGELSRDVMFSHCDNEQIKTEVICKMTGGEWVEMEEETKDNPLLVYSGRTEFHDAPEFSDDDHSDKKWIFDQSPEMSYSDTCQQKLTSACNFMKNHHDLPARQKNGYLDLQDMAWEDKEPSYYGATLPKDSTHNLPCSWAVGDPSLFLIRGEKYLEDYQKVKAKGTLTQLVGADWLNSQKREEDLGSRPGGIVERYAAKGEEEFFFIINMQIPGASAKNLAFYYMLRTPLKETPLLESFVNGNDTFRNSKFKIIPHVSKGPWIVKQSVGNRGCLLGKVLKAHYIRRKNYLEIDIDVGSSMVARRVASLVLGNMTNVVVELAFLIQADNEKELPEVLLGTCRLNGLDMSKTVSIDSISSSS